MERDDKVPQFKLTAVQYVILAVMVVLIFRLARLPATQFKQRKSRAAFLLRAFDYDACECLVVYLVEGTGRNVRFRLHDCCG